MKIDWGTSTVSDEVKIQQGLQYKIQNLDLLYKAGIISQEQYAWAMGYDSPDEKEPRVSLEDQFAKGGNTCLLYTSIQSHSTHYIATIPYSSTTHFKGKLKKA